MSRLETSFAAKIFVALCVAAMLSAVPIQMNSLSTASRLADAVKVENIFAHLNGLQQVASVPEFKGSRSIANGYNASADFVIQTLKANTPYTITKQHFRVAVWTEYESALSLTSPFSVIFKNLQDFGALRYGGSGNYSIVAPFTQVNQPCNNSAEWAAFPKGNIALFLAGGACSDYDKVRNAENAGASAILIHPAFTASGYSRSYLLPDTWVDGDFLLTIPGFGISASTAQLILGLGASARITLTYKGSIDYYTTFNIICETNVGNPNSVVVVGAHLDSVPAAPGLNDDGSGTASILEMAIQFYRLGLNPPNRVRFCWWGAEEIGLLGSYHYLRVLQQTDPESLKRISLNLNFDMLASPNYVAFVYDGLSAPVAVQPGSVEIQKVFEEYYRLVNRPYILSRMGGGSDYYPFLLSSIPAGGLYTGAGSIKTAEQRTRFGGLANAAHDPCYHLACDSIENIDVYALEETSKAGAYVLDILSADPNLRQRVSRP
eukprot:TRINITY_DN2317_c0_g1_i1.p1 TRINITY_DN2317_c0_g1~~TRINITY_DN2317_c0_g1_i1.p1  ORF type:complete len:491 (+),score=111.32 TRINITY_DN2317_c0_g1_i1:48-1520(+)